MTIILDVRDVYKRFGGIEALKGVSFSVRRGERVGLIGPNGAGKTTLFNIISGIYMPDRGRVIYKGVDITGWPAYRRSRAGIARTFQIVRPLANLTVLNNVIVGALLRTNDIREARERAMEAIDMVGLAGKEDILAKDLNLIEKKRLELARALATQPELLLLDEIAAGLRPREVDDLVYTLLEISKRGITIIMVEHVMRAVMNFAERVIVLHFGEKIAEGTPREVASNKLVIEAYMGTGG
ncbi:branched-chain amino acid ABC transporter, ATP binding protein [Aeropyrum pernix K1]|uniref:Branched-chain amino acid ABC transporter, ATP binding protein n=1 Tax=Aeropyrum pernix (strain ATCC 700893 / DSM 11879 / JCM 9820 / NBRC 100138 / K1) TaxID=272557 RepID=Q9Y8W0_AERPE|nr:ABC transporter ATP-binding protein [Aeropyrum pernix]BAA81540.2 branched-chain amino acid ABC transporter, ATP binding protein [Aeropyrum pernix K1]